MKTLRLPLLCATVLFASVGLSLSTAAPATHTVNLTTPWKVGQTYTAAVSATESTHVVLTLGDQKLQEQKQQRSAKLDADSKVLAVYSHGGLRKAEFTVRTLRASLNGTPEAVYLPPGAKIVAESTGGTEKTYTIDGAEASAEQKSILELVISLDAEKHTDQIIFGPKKPVAVGENWLLDGTALKETLGKGLGEIGATQGAMRLDAIEGSGDGQIAIVSGNVAFTGIKPALPPGITPKSGVFKAVLDGRIPATRTASKRVENLTADADLKGEAAGPNGATITFSVKVDVKHASTLTFP